VAGALARRAQRTDDGGVYWESGDGNPRFGPLTWGGSTIETTALALRALALTPGADADLLRGAVKWLEARKTGTSWASTRDTAFVVSAYTAFLKRTRPTTPTQAPVVVTVNGRRVGTIDPAGDAPYTLTVPGSRLPAGSTVRVALTGGADATAMVSMNLTSVVRSAVVAPRADRIEVSRFWRAEEADTDSDDRELLTSLDRPVDEPIDTIVLGGLVAVELTIFADADMDDVVIRDPLPAGLTFLDGTSDGADFIAARPGEVLIALDKLRRGKTRITYLARAERIGRYRALPTTAALIYHPGIWARARSATLDVITPAAWEAIVQATPDARARRLYQTGMQALAAGNTDEVVTAFQALLGFERLRTDVAADLHRELLMIAFDRATPAAIRDHIDAIGRIGHSLPDMTTAQTMAAAEAFLAADRPWETITFARNTLADAYARDKKAALEQGDALGDSRAETFLNAIRTYPMSEQWFLDLVRAATMARDEAKPADKLDAYIDGLELVAAESAGGMWQRKAMYDIIIALAQAGRFTDARDRAQAWLRVLDADREPLVDNLTYLVAYTSFALDDRDAATRFAKQLVQRAYVLGSPMENNDRFYILSDAEIAERRADGKLMGESEFRRNAAHLLAQLAHAAGNLDEAVKWYREAAPTFRDAQLALTELTAVEFDVPAFQRVTIGETAGLPIEGRNLESVEAAVYPFDLGFCFTVRKHLRNLHTIDLTGLSPSQVLTPDVEMQPYRRFATSLDLGKLDKGAYLVLVKSGDMIRSAIVLVSDIRAEVRRSGRTLRVSVEDAEGKPVVGATVKVSDGRNRIVATGKTDVRGIFQAEGGSAVLVEHEGEYALPDMK
jgi:tetratricopeptide (TPR) repeat protein